MSGVIDQRWDGGTLVLQHYDVHTDELHVERRQDVEPILDRIKRIKAAGFDGYNADRSFRAIAEVPITFLEDLAKTRGIEAMNPDHEEAFLKVLDDPVLRDLRLDTRQAHAGSIIVTGSR